MRVFFLFFFFFLIYIFLNDLISILLSCCWEWRNKSRCQLYTPNDESHFLDESFILHPYERENLNLPTLFNVYLAALDQEMLFPQSSHAQLSYLKYGCKLIKDKKGQDFGFMFCLKDLDIPACTDLSKIILRLLSVLIYNNICQI